MADWPNWISAGSAATGVLIAGLTSIVGLRAFLHQRTSSDVKLALEIFSEINRYWDKIVENPIDPNYYYGQILTQFEIAASLFNDNVLTADASKILSDHMIEVFTSLQSSESGRSLLEHCRSSGHTFEELEHFAKINFPSALLSLAFSRDKLSQ